MMTHSPPVDFTTLVTCIRDDEGLPRWMPGRLPMLARAGGSHGLNPLLALITSGAILLVGQLIGAGLSMLVPLDPGGAAGFWGAMILSFVGVIIATIGMVMLKRRGLGPWRGLGFCAVTPSRAVMVGVALAALGLAGPVLPLMARGALSFSAAMPPAVPSLIALSILAFTVQASAEEILIRGWLLPELITRVGLWAAILVSSGVFAALHLGNDNVSAIALINIALVGVVFCLLVIAQGALWGACAFHAFWNWAQSVGLGIEVSGLRVPTTLLQAQTGEAVPVWLSGGAFGIEASVLTTVMLVLQIGLIRVWAGRSGRWQAVSGAARARAMPLAA